MELKKNFFSGMEAKTKVINRSNNRSYTIRDSRMRFFFPDEWMAFYDCLKSKQRVTFQFLINLGARISEIRHIQAGDVDFERKSIILKFTKSRNRDGTRKIRVIPFSSKFGKFINRVSLRYKLKPEDYFPILSIPGANYAMRTALKKAGIADYKNFSIHNVRKTLETWLLSLDIDSMKVVKHFGHSFDIASKHYVSPDTFSWDDKQKMREIIGDLYQR